MKGKKPLAALLDLLADGSKAKAKISVTATDGAGNASPQSFSVGVSG